MQALITSLAAVKAPLKSEPDVSLLSNIGLCLGSCGRVSHKPRRPCCICLQNNQRAMAAASLLQLLSKESWRRTWHGPYSNLL